MLPPPIAWHQRILKSSGTSVTTAFQRRLSAFLSTLVVGLGLASRPALPSPSGSRSRAMRTRRFTCFSGRAPWRSAGPRGHGFGIPAVRASRTRAGSTAPRWKAVPTSGITSGVATRSATCSPASTRAGSDWPEPDVALDPYVPAPVGSAFHNVRPPDTCISRDWRLPSPHENRTALAPDHPRDPRAEFPAIRLRTGYAPYGRSFVRRLPLRWQVSYLRPPPRFASTHAHWTDLGPRNTL
ncbi:hypothetical protein M2351_006174 [Azospirillum canadense]|nr:hypothetical protein [Azospirillum canadense]